MKKMLSIGFWELVARAILRNRLITILVGIIAITVLLGLQWKNVKFTQTEANLIPADDKVNVDYNTFLQNFGEEGNLIVVATKDQKLFTPKVFTAWTALMEKVRNDKQISLVISINNLQNLVKNDTLQSFQLKPFVNPQKANDALYLQNLKKELLQNVAHVALILDILGITDPLPLVVSSYGGGVAARFAEMRPERVTKLVIYDGLVSDYSMAMADSIARSVGGESMLAVMGTPAVKDLRYGIRLALYRNPPLPGFILKQVYNANVKPFRPAQVTLIKDLMEHEEHFATKQYTWTMPVYLIWGERDELDPECDRASDHAAQRYPRGPLGDHSAHRPCGQLGTAQRL